MKNSNSASGNKTDYFDVIIIGSGPAGVNAAYPLIKAGLKVAIVDGGLESSQDHATPRGNSSQKNTSNPQDLLMKTGYVYTKTYQLLKVEGNIDIVQSLAKGGLSEIWHGMCDYFTPSELTEIGLPPEAIEEEYKEVAKRAGLNSTPSLDLHCELLAKNGGNKVYKLPILYPYRTSSVVDYLKKHKNFTYIPQRLVLRAKNNKNYVEVESISIEDHTPLGIKSRYLILAAGAVNTTRILLQSLGLVQKVPFTTKGHTMIVCFHPRALPKLSKEKLLNLGQIALQCEHTEKGLNSFFVQFYRCNPFASEMALQYIPLPRFLAKILFSLIAPYLLIADVRFPSFPSKNKYCLLEKGEDINDAGVLKISLGYTPEELAEHKKQLKGINKELWSLGLIPFKKVNSDVTSHYAGGAPIQEKPGTLSTNFEGRLHQAKRIYIADSASWRALPGKPPTLTIMANASLVAKHVLSEIRLERKILS